MADKAAKEKDKTIKEKSDNITTDTEKIEQSKDISVEIKTEQDKTGSVLDKINASIKDVTTNDIVVGKSRKVSDSVELTEEIPCMSLFFGKLVYISPTNSARYVWKDMGSVVYIPFGELQTMRNHKPIYFEKPYIVINDSKVVNYFRLLPIYEKIANLNELDKLFNTGDLTLITHKVHEIVGVGMRDVAISKIRSMVKNGELTNINIIKLLEIELKTSLSE